MSERLNNVTTDLKLSDARYVDLLQVYRKQARGDVQEEAKNILIDNLTERSSVKVRVRYNILT